MSFLHPWMLLGLLGVALPIVLHLLNRRRAVRVAFAPMRFLLESQKRREKALRLKRWLLLAFRVLLVLLLPLAMAQPLVRCGGEDAHGVGADARLPASIVFVVEDSPPMSARGERVDVWAQVTEQIDRRTRQMRAWDRAALVVASHEPRVPLREPIGDRVALLQALRGVAPTFGAVDLPAALREARALHEEAALSTRVTVVLVSGDERPWRSLLAQDEGSLAGLGQIEIQPLAREALHNVSVGALRVEPAAEGVPGTLAIRAPLTSLHYPEGVEVDVALFVAEEQVALRRVRVADGAPAEAEFMHLLEEEGTRAMRVEVQGVAQSWRADDLRHGVLQRGGALRVLLVNGDLRAAQVNDELFFLERAMDALRAGGVDLSLRVVTPDALTRERLELFDVALLANVGELPAGVVEGLAAWVEGGGGLWITAGDQIRADAQTRAIDPLLPRPVRSVRRLTRPSDPDASVRATRPANVDREHPVFRLMDPRSSWEQVEVYEYLLLEPLSAESRARAVASYADGGPALIDEPRGQGRILLWTSSVDADWTDLPFRPAYLPWIHHTLDYLGRRLGRSSAGGVVGQRQRFALDALGVEGALEVTTPRGERLVLSAEEGSAAVSFVPREGGVYRVASLAAGGSTPMPALDFAVNGPVVDPLWVPLDDEAMETLRRWSGGRVAEGAGAGVHERNAWPLLLFLLLVVFYGETLLAMRRRLWEGLFARRGRS